MPIIGPSGQLGGGSQPTGTAGLNWAYGQLWWDLRYNWPGRQQYQLNVQQALRDQRK